ncbi:hypothetical protein B0H13DRAFT_2349364 [Mycena leptocephala]|nr:hypothetical protein B0H13DRAFT_2349364 [Mycena leptocephala]
MIRYILFGIFPTHGGAAEGDFDIGWELGSAAFPAPFPGGGYDGGGYDGGEMGGEFGEQQMEFGNGEQVGNEPSELDLLLRELDFKMDTGFDDVMAGQTA